MGVRLGRLGRRPSPLAGRLLLMLFLLGGFTVLWADWRLTPVIQAVAEIEARALAAEAINRVVIDGVARGLENADLVTYVTDRDGRVSIVRANTAAVNRVAAQAAEAIQNEFRDLTGQRFYIPLGQISGSRLLGATGPRLPLTVVPHGSVLVSVRQALEEAGINQTRHVITLETRARLRVVVPFTTQEVEVVHELPLTEAVIVGPVPGTYLRADLGRWGSSAPVWPVPAGSPGT